MSPNTLIAFVDRMLFVSLPELLRESDPRDPCRSNAGLISMGSSLIACLKMDIGLEGPHFQLIDMIEIGDLKEKEKKTYDFHPLCSNESTKDIY